MLDQLMSALQEQQALFQFSRRGDTGPDDPDYPVHIPLATSAQICRAIKQHSATFSSSGRDMILCAIVDLVEFESFRNVYQKFDVHGKACFLHNLSIMDSMDILQCVVEELPHAGDTLFRMYLATCSGNVGELPDNKKPEQIVPKDIFFSKLLSPDMEFFFVSDLAAYLTEAQWQLLSKEFEKNEKERKARKKPQANVKTEAVEFDIEIFEDEVDENPTTLISASPSIDRFEMIMLNYLRHQNLSSAQLLQLVANTFLSMLDEKEFSELIDKCWSRFPLDGQWSKALAVVQDLGTNKNPVPPSSSTTGSTEEMNYERIAAIRLKLLKKTFMMLSQEERAAWIDRTNAKHPTETYKKKIQDLEDAAEFAMNKPPDLSDPETHVSNMKGEMKMRWLDAIVDAMLTDPEQSKRISALKQVLQPFANGKTPPPVIPTSSTVTPSSPSSVARSAAIAPPRPATSPAQPTPLTLATAEVGLEQLLSQLNPADKAVFLSKFSPSPAETQKGPDKEVIHRASSPVGFVEEQLPSVETGSPEIQKTLQALLEQKSETQVLEILQDELENSSSDEEPEVPVAENILETPSTGVSLSSRLKRKLTAVTAVAEPMEWQEYVKVGCLDVGCQTNFESEQQPIEATNSTDSVSVVPNVKVPNRGNHRTSTAPTKTVPLTLASLLGKNNGIMNTAGGKSKKDKYQKISSTSVPRSIAGLITSWRMNTEQLTQFAKKSLATVLKIIADAFSEMLTANRRKAQQQQLSYATPRGSGRTLTLSQIVYQSFLHSYGLPSIADMHLLAFSCALETYRLQHLRAEYFARFCFDEVPKSELTNYLEFLEYIVCDDLSVCTLGPNTPMNPPSTPHSGISNSRTSSLHSALPMPTVASKRIRHVPKVNVPDKENWQISLDRAQEIAQLCFRDMRKSAVVAFCENLATIAVQGNSTAILPVPTPAEAPNGELLVNVDHLLQLAVTEWKREQTRRERHLMDAFRAGDVNGDGQLTSAEFTQIVLSIDASRDQGDILLMYSDTLRRTECEQLSPEIFLQVAREHELDRVVWQGDGELFGVVNEVTDMEATWTHVRGFFVGTLESLARDLPAGHFLRVCEGAGCGCLKCLLDGYVGFQTMRRDFAATQNQQQQPAQQGKRNSEVGVSSQLVWARFWHLMRQLHDAATESGGIITPWEGVEYIREQAVQPLAPRSNNRRRDSLPNFLFPDTARITAKMSQAHEPEAFDAPTIHSQFAYLLRHVSTKTSEST
ncbi:hypothetical protein PHYBOEH_009429 [Phytophthora boehmeriae]|uniref:EF-hand domain-containing protein n=1 Tax=Phytophthora boehmeriae TaxID=109152 RepID=A0A8T1VX61_9STRA|nr:hypothetical protein PHYBOEH_009429 [Phytophthora boehmeriae]